MTTIAASPSRDAADGDPPGRPPDAMASRALTWLLVVSAAVVPALFTTSLEDVFTLPKLAALWLVVVLALVVMSVAALQAGWRVLAPIALSPADLAVAAFVVLNVGALAASRDFHQSFFGERWQYQGVATVFLYAGFYALARLTIDSAARLRLLLTGITIGASAVAVCGVAQRAGLDIVFDRAELPGGRVFATIGQPNALAAYLVIAIPAAGALLVHHRSTRVRVVLILAICSMVASSLLSYSRSGNFGLLIVLPIVAIGVVRRWGISWRRIARVAAAASVLVIASVAFLEPVNRVADELWQRATSSFDLETPPPRECLVCGGPGDISIRRRFDFWEIAGQMALDHPLLGIGPETYPDRFAEYSHALLPVGRALEYDQYRIESPHNVPLAIASGSGIPALLAYLGVVASVIVGLFRSARLGHDLEARVTVVFLMAAMIGHLVTDLFMTAELTSTWIFWMLLGAGATVAARARVVPDEISVEAVQRSRTRGRATGAR